MQILNTIEEIKEAVDQGKQVFCDTAAYQVIKDSAGQYLITFLGSNWCCGLHGQEGTKYARQLNGTKFYY